MSSMSKIEWTEATWNPVTGCKKISSSCKNCYAETFANRFKGVPGHPYEQGFSVKLWQDRLSLPLYWKTPKFVFVNSMSDLFLDEVDDIFIKQVFSTMVRANWHVFQVLTKRPERMLSWSKNNYKKSTWPSNVWLGVSVESTDYLCRVELLKKTPAKVKFVSFEPLLDKLDLHNGSLDGIDWVIVGGESGPKARRMPIEWVDGIFDYSLNHNISFFFKQWGTFDRQGNRVGKKKAGRLYRGGVWNQMPVVSPINS